jgi:hypothetical protein
MTLVCFTLGPENKVLKRLDGWWNQKWIRVLEKELPCFAADEKG